MAKRASLVLKIFLLFVIVSFTFSLANFSFSKEGISLQKKTNIISRGEKLFKSNCSGCHLNGQNLIRSDRPIIGSTKIKSKQAFKAWLENPISPMPSFENITNKPKQLDALYAYVISLMGK